MGLGRYPPLHVETGRREGHPTTLVALVTNGSERIHMLKVTVEAKVPVIGQQRDVP